MLIVCNGMIRSGSTLQYNLVRGLVEKMNVGKAEGWFSPNQLNEKSKQLEDWAGSQLLHVIKSHVILPCSKELLAKDSLRICYIYRDIRDVAVSVKNKWNRTGEELLRTLEQAIATYREIKAMDLALMQRYEEVIDDLSGALKAIAKFLRLEPGDDIISNILQENSLDRAKIAAETASRSYGLRARTVLLQIGSKIRGADLMRILGISESFIQSTRNALLPYDKRTLLHPNHLSKHAGTVGLWHNELTKDETKEISERFKQWLKGTNYV